MSLYEDLGVDADADTAEIKKAFKRAAQRSHPDREGGSIEEFQAVSKAYEILSDPARRKAYDTTGSVDDPVAGDPVEGKLMELFASISDDVSGDVIERCQQKIASTLNDLTQRLTKLELSLGKNMGQLGRVSCKGDHNLYEQFINHKITEINRELEHFSDEKSLIEKVGKRLDEYEDTNPQPKFDNGFRWDTMSSPHL